MSSITGTRFGDLAYEDDRVVTFPGGLLGFEEMKRYVLLNVKGPDYPFRWLQSLDEPGLAFLLFEPSEWFPQYCPPVPAEDLAMLGLSSLQDAIVVCVVTVPRDPGETTANFQSPLIINTNKRLGKQVVTGLPSYKIRQLIFDLKPLQRKTG